MKTPKSSSKKLPWGRVLAVALLSLLIITGTVIWIIVKNGPWLTILPIAFTVLGVFITLFQWLFPVSPASESAGVREKPTSSPPVLVQTETPTPLQPQIVFQVPSVEQTPLVNKPTYRSIEAVPPPTNARTIQQRVLEVQAIYAQLQRPDLTALVLTGIGGVGKSTLAALVYQYAEEQRHSGSGLFNAEALWLHVDSSAVTMSDLVGSIFHALGKPLPDLTMLAPQNQAATLYNALNSAPTPRLVVLDQFENLLDWRTGHVLTDRPGIGEWLDAINSQPCRCRLLLTSRPFPLGTRDHPPTYMQEYYVSGLDLAEGSELLRKLGIQGDEKELHLAVERCAGHAYALTLLAALLRNRHVSLTTFFKDPMYSQLWVGNVARNLLDHICTQQLNPLQHRLLLAFALYREPVPLEAARAIADPDTQLPLAQLSQALDALLMQHVLQSAGEGLYQLHAIVISYAFEHFDTSSEQANTQAKVEGHLRAAQYYMRVAAEHCPPRAQRRQRSDVQPLIEAFWHYCKGGQQQAAHTLLVQEGLYSDLLRWGNTVTLLELYQLLLPLDKWQASAKQSARIYDDLGVIYRLLGRMKQAQEYFEKALTLCRTLGEHREEGWALNNLGRLNADTGKKQYALTYYEEALRIHREVNDLGGMGTVLTNIGWAYYDVDQMDQARAKYEEALLIRRNIQDRRGEASALNSLGRVYEYLGQKEEARKTLEQALQICREIGDRSGEGWTLNNLGRVLAQLNQNKLAEEYYEAALKIRREIGDRRGEGATLSNFGNLLANIGDYERARQCYDRALALRREVGDRNGEGKTLNYLGLLSLRRGEYTHALPFFWQAFHIHHDLSHEKRQGEVLLSLARCYLELRHYEIALACLLEAEQNFAIAQSQDTTIKAHLSEIVHTKQEMSLKLGEETWQRLLTDIESRSQQLVRETLNNSNPD